MTFPTRVVFVAHEAGSGGVARTLAEVVPALAERGRVRCGVVVPAEGWLADRLRIANVPVAVARHRWWTTLDEGERAGPRVRTAIRALRVARIDGRRVADAIVDLGADVVVATSVVAPAGVVAARMVGVPSLWWVHEFGDLDHGLRFHLGRRASVALLKRRATATVANSRAVARTLGRGVTVVEPGIPVDRGSPTSWAPGEPLRLLQLGRRNRAKGADDAVRVAATLADAGLDVHVRLVGAAQPGFEGDLARLADDLGIGARVSQHDEHEDAVGEIDRSHVVLVCSRREAFGRVAVEALRRGRAVAAYRCGGVAEIVDDGATGVLTEPGAPDRLAGALRARLEEDGWLRAAGERAMEVSRRWAPETRLEALEAMVDDVASRGRP